MAYCVLPQGLIKIEDGDHVVVLVRRRIPTGQRLPYDDQRLIMKAMVVGVKRPCTPEVPPGYLGKSIVYHR